MLQRVLQRVAACCSVCCRVLQHSQLLASRVARKSRSCPHFSCCSVLQCVAVCCSMSCSVLQHSHLLVSRVAQKSRSFPHFACCCVLQCVAVCCSVLQSVAVQRVAACVAVCWSTANCLKACCPKIPLPPPSPPYICDAQDMEHQLLVTFFVQNHSARKCFEFIYVYFQEFILIHFQFIHVLSSNMYFCNLYTNIPNFLCNHSACRCVILLAGVWIHTCEFSVLLKYFDTRAGYSRIVWRRHKNTWVL